MDNNGFCKSSNKIRIYISKNCMSDSYLVYMTILSFKNKSYDSCYPSYECLMEETGMCESALKKRLRSLCESGVLIIKSGSQGKNSRYFFPLEDKMYTNDELSIILSYKRRKSRGVIDSNELTELQKEVKGKISKSKNVKKKPYTYSIKQLSSKPSSLDKCAELINDVKSDIARIFGDDCIMYKRLNSINIMTCTDESFIELYNFAVEKINEFYKREQMRNNGEIDEYGNPVINMIRDDVCHEQ